MTVYGYTYRTSKVIKGSAVSNFLVIVGKFYFNDVNSFHNQFVKNGNKEGSTLS